MRRREFLGVSLAGVAAGVTGQDPAVRPAATPTPAYDPTQMAALLLATPRDKLVPLALQWTAAGASPRDLLGSASSMSAWLRGKHTVLPALFNLDRVKNSQARDERQGDWTMPAAPPTDARETPVLAAEFATAMETGRRL